MNALPTHGPPPPKVDTYARTHVTLHTYTHSQMTQWQLCVPFIFGLMCLTADDTDLTHPPIQPPPYLTNTHRLTQSDTSLKQELCDLHLSKGSLLLP